MIKLAGLEKLQRELKEAQKAFAAIDGELGSVNFDPYDPGSIERAIQEGHTLIDERVGQYADNPFVAPLIDQMKEHQRQSIIEQASAARLKPEDGDA